MSFSIVDRKAMLSHSSSSSKYTPRRRRRENIISCKTRIASNTKETLVLMKAVKKQQANKIFVSLILEKKLIRKIAYDPD